jgi:hypothetical protein
MNFINFFIDQKINTTILNNTKNNIIFYLFFYNKLKFIIYNKINLFYC